MATNTRCPDKAEFERLLTGPDTEAEESQVVGHLDTCAECRKTLEELASGENHNLDAVGNTINVMLLNEDELRRLVLIRLAIT